LPHGLNVFADNAATQATSRILMKKFGVVQQPLISGNTGVAIPPHQVRDFSHNGKLTGLVQEKL